MEISMVGDQIEREEMDGKIDLLEKLFVVAKALKLIETHKEISTRAFLRAYRSWGYSYVLLRELERFGLVERVERKCGEDDWRVCKYNKLSEKGRHFLAKLDELVKMISEGRDS